jgi:sulfide:quinone oxidoreductase
MLEEVLLADIRQVTPAFAVAPQIDAADFAAIAAAGFKSVINNRPDGEAPNQMPDAAAKAGAEAAGLAYAAIPVAGGPGPAQIERTIAALRDLPTPVLAYCRSGTRSITAWALAQAGARATEEIIALARNAGYDLSALKGALGAAQR